MILQGKQVRLRATERDDLPLAVQYLNDPEVLMWFGQPAPLPLGMGGNSGNVGIFSQEPIAAIGQNGR